MMNTRTDESKPSDQNMRNQQQRNKEVEAGQFDKTNIGNMEPNEARPSENMGNKIQEKTEWVDDKGNEVLEAIDETIVEIAQTTKDLVIGEDADTDKTKPVKGSYSN